MKRNFLFIGLLVSALTLTAAAQDRARSPTFVATPDVDPEMSAAIARAQSEVGRFWTTFANPSKGESAFSVKRKFAEGNGWEYMWVAVLKRENGRVTGRVDNRPEGLRDVKPGQIVTFDESEIADWLFMREGKMYGNFTLRPLLSRMPPERAAKVRSLLAEP
jgi:uncharacterized protein YegJ (DUF2314 family)